MLLIIFYNYVFAPLHDHYQNTDSKWTDFLKKCSLSVVTKHLEGHDKEKNY